jgi:hypothetical protein
VIWSLNTKAKAVYFDPSAASLTAATLDLDFNTTVFYHRFKIEN